MPHTVLQLTIYMKTIIDIKWGKDSVYIQIIVTVNVRYVISHIMHVNK